MFNFGLLQDAAALLADVESLASGFADLPAQLIAVGKDVALVWATHSGATFARLLTDLRSAWAAAKNDYTGAQPQVAKFVADAEAIIADLRK